MIIAKIVRSAGKLSIELPSDFPIMEGAEVNVRKEGDNVILEPIASSEYRARILTWLDTVREPLDEDFVQAALEDPGPAETRDFWLLD